MRCGSLRFSLFFLFVGVTSQPALADKADDIKLEIQNRYDPLKTGRLTGDRLRVFEAHRADPVLKKYDLNNNGVLDETELTVLLKDIREKYAKKKPTEVRGPPTPEVLDDLAQVGRVEYEVKHGGLPLEDVIEIPKPITDGCRPSQNLYVRRDRLDTFLYGITPTSKAQGASVSYTDDLLGSKQSAAIDGFLGYVAHRDLCIDPPSRDVGIPYISAFVIAPWADAHGTVSSASPRTVKTEQSSLKSGADIQMEISGGPLLDLQYLSVSPYYQTDFRGSAAASGVSIAWQPYRLDIGLGGNHRRFSEYIDGFWQLQAELDHRSVTRSGLTSMAPGDQTWVGETARLNVTFFPGEQFPETVRNRFHFIGTYSSFWNTVARTNVSQGKAELAYNVIGDGSASVSVEYGKGRDKDTLVNIERYLVKLNYKY